MSRNVSHGRGEHEVLDGPLRDPIVSFHDGIRDMTLILGPEVRGMTVFAYLIQPGQLQHVTRMPTARGLVDDRVRVRARVRVRGRVGRGQGQGQGQG